MDYELFDDDVNDTNNDIKFGNACMNGDLSIIKLMVAVGYDFRDKIFALMDASLNGHLNVVKYLVENGIKKDFRFPIRWASRKRRITKGHISVCRYLIENGANIDDMTDEYNGKMKKMFKCLRNILMMRRRRVRRNITLLQRFVLKRSMVRLIPYLPELGAEYQKGEERFYSSVSY